MPKSSEQIADELNDKLRLSGGPVMTMSWPEFYKLGDIQRFKAPRGEDIQKAASANWSLAIAYGQAVVVVAHDRNFAPA